MPSRTFIRSLLFVAAFVGVSAVGASAQAGIIVTVGRPCPEFQLPRKPTPDQRMQMQMAAENADTCIMTPDGQMRCAKIMRVETMSSVPADWRCVPIAKSVLYCETPGYGSSPGAAGEGAFDPSMDEEDFLDDEEIQTLGCEGAGVGSLAGIAGLVALVMARRRRV